MDDLNFTSSNYFLHHGIEGQKWGIQNGPPYPLDSETHKDVIKEKKKDYRVSTKNTKKAIAEEAKNFERSKWKKGSLIVGKADPELVKKANAGVIETYNKKMDYKTVKKGEDWLYKHRDDLFEISAANVTKVYNPKNGTIHTTRYYYY